ncbi:MAG: zeta toxin family protein [Muribaculaceae bacterium]|nr:zeta toxin family protein [Muribaculaceae bacterium]
MGSSNKSPELIIIAGPNGSGKTTITTQFLHHEWSEGILYINPDIIAQEKFGDWNSTESILKAAQYCENLREDCLRERRSFVFETVFSAKDKIDFILRAKEAGFFIRLFFIATSSPAINASRIANRVMEGGHDVAISKIISRYQKSIINCSLIAPIVDRLYVYDNSVDNAMATLQYRLSNGVLVKQYVDEVVGWAMRILKQTG